MRMGGEPLLRASDHEFGAERLAFFFFKVPVVADQHDPVSRGDSQHRDESDK